MFDDKIGLIKKDTVVDIDEAKAQFYVVRGYAKIYVAKVVDEQPSVEQTIEVQPKKRTKKTKVIED